MKPISLARKQLRQSINASRSANGIRYLLAIWPDTWDWMERMNTHFHGLPMLTPGTDRVFDLEIHNVLYDIGHLGTALSNGTLKAAVRRRILTSLAACARTTVTNAQGEAWDWTDIPFAGFLGAGKAARLDRRDPDIAGLRIMTRRIIGPVPDSELTDSEIQHLFLTESTGQTALGDASNG